MAKEDPLLFEIKQKQLPKNLASEKLSVFVNEYTWDSIKKELLLLSKRQSSKHPVLKFIAEPVRLEFLVALAIKAKFPRIIVVPNYSCDDEGLPTSTAGGNKGDIECYESQNGVLVEVTMAGGRQQTMMEIWPIERHLKEFLESQECQAAQCVFVAPSIFADSIQQIEFVKYKDGLIIRPYTIDAFSDYLESSYCLYDKC